MGHYSKMCLLRSNMTKPASIASRFFRFFCCSSVPTFQFFFVNFFLTFNLSNGQRYILVQFLFNFFNFVQFSSTFHFWSTFQVCPILQFCPIFNFCPILINFSTLFHLSRAVVVDCNFQSCFKAQINILSKF